MSKMFLKIKLAIKYLHSNLLTSACRDDLRTANIICDDPDGVSCLVIDRETFNQLISNLDEIKMKYKDEGDERRRFVAFHIPVFQSRLLGLLL